MNKKLTINIPQESNQSNLLNEPSNHHQIHHQPKSQQNQESSLGSDYEEEEEQASSNYGYQSHSTDPRDSSKQLYQYESLQTFANKNSSERIFENQKQRAEMIKTLKDRYEQKQSQQKQKLQQDYYDHRANLKFVNRAQPYYQNFFQQNEDRQISRIVAKVMMKKQERVTNPEKGINQCNDRQIEGAKLQKVQVVNRSLLIENTSLMKEINSWAKRLEKINKKISQVKRKNQLSLSRSKNHQEGKLHISIKRFKEKISKAEDLNSRLESRLIQEKSLSRVNQKKLKKLNEDKSNQTISVLSTIKSREYTTKLKANKFDQIPKMRQQNMCQKCHHNISSIQEKVYGSPILQMKSYTIDQTRKISQFENDKMQLLREFGCQTNMQEEEYQEKIKNYEEEEEKLSRIIQENNKKIQFFERRCLRMIDE